MEVQGRDLPPRRHADQPRRGKLKVICSVRELPAAQPLADIDGKTAGSSALYYAQMR